MATPVTTVLPATITAPPMTSVLATPAPVDTPLALSGPVWELASLTENGVAVAISEQDDISFSIVPDYNPCDCPDGPMMLGHDGCNSFERSVTVTDEAVTYGDYGMSTAMACEGGFHDTLARSSWSYGEGFAYELTEPDQLRIVSPDGSIELVFRSRVTEFAPTTGEIVAEGQAHFIVYRAMWEGGGLSLEWRDLSRLDYRPAVAGVGFDAERINAFRFEFGSGLFLLAVLPTNVVRATYTSGSITNELTVHPVDNPAASTVAESVGWDGPDWSIITYDADGNELDRFDATAAPSATVPWSSPAGGSGDRLRRADDG